VIATASFMLMVGIASARSNVTRLKSADDLELLMNVLKANKFVFAKIDRLATEVLTLTQVSGGSGSAPSKVGGLTCPPRYARHSGLH
jgi:hypothetical protein